MKKILTSIIGIALLFSTLGMNVLAEELDETPSNPTTNLSEENEGEPYALSLIHTTINANTRYAYESEWTDQKDYQVYKGDVIQMQTSLTNKEDYTLQDFRYYTRIPVNNGIVFDDMTYVEKGALVYYTSIDYKQLSSAEVADYHDWDAQKLKDLGFSTTRSKNEPVTGIFIDYQNFKLKPQEAVNTDIQYSVFSREIGNAEVFTSMSFGDEEIGMHQTRGRNKVSFTMTDQLYGVQFFADTPTTLYQEQTVQNMPRNITSTSNIIKITSDQPTLAGYHFDYWTNC